MKINCKKAKNIDLHLYLKKNGFEPQKIRQNESWFLSPFRNEKTASFKVDISKNVWYDFAVGLGGTIIDFVMRYNHCTIKEALEILNEGTFSFQQQSILIKPKNKSNYEITKVGKIKHPNLISYIQQRKLNFEFTDKFCYQVHYSFDKIKEYYGIGFLNDSGGFDIRNKYFKGCLGKKNITSIKNDSNVVSIFESWSDFLSYVTLKKEIPKEDFIILNSTSMVKKAIDLLDNYSQIKIFFDNDKAGDIATGFLIKNIKNQVIDNRISYKNYNDLNDFLINTK